MEDATATESVPSAATAKVSNEVSRDAVDCATVFCCHTVSRGCPQYGQKLEASISICEPHNGQNIMSPFDVSFGLTSAATNDYEELSIIAHQSTPQCSKMTVSSSSL